MSWIKDPECRQKPSPCVMSWMLSNIYNNRIQDCHLFKECKEKYWEEQKVDVNKTAPSPPSKLSLHIETISKTEGLKALLYQVQNSVKRVITYASMSVNKTEMKYPVHKLEF